MLERVIVIARYPTPGRAKTRLIPLLGPQGAADAHDELVRLTLNVIRQTGAAIEVRFTGATRDAMAGHYGNDIDYVEQGEGDLGDRLKRAVADHENQKRVVIGTDCPALTPAIVRRAFDLLDECDVVLGPAVDGGYYMIAVKANHPRLFEGISWGGEHVLAQTISACEAGQLSHRLLDTLSDVDTPADYQLWKNKVTAPKP